MHLLSFTTLAALTASAQDFSTSKHYVSHEKRASSLKRWIDRGGVSSDAVLPMRIGLRQPNVDNGMGDELMAELSPLDSPCYGQRYSPEDIVELFAPPQEAFDGVCAWLEDAGIAAPRISHSANKQWIQFDARAHKAEMLLKTKYYHYEHEHETTGSLHVACNEYYVPSHLSEHVDYIAPGIKLLGGGKASGGRLFGGCKDDLEKRGFRTGSKQNFSSPIVGPIVSRVVAALLGNEPLSQRDQYVTPDCIMAMYNITHGDKAAPGYQLGIFEEGDFYAAEDLMEFFTLLAPKIPITTRPELKGIDGGFAPGLLAGGKSDLDFQISSGGTVLPGGASAAQDQEIAVTRFPSGGGFSNIYKRPDHQSAAVNIYLTEHTPPYKTYGTSGTNNPAESTANDSIYNAAGRGYPDVFAVGDNVVVFLNGLPTLIGGTSASVPVFAAIITRINEERIAVGKKPVESMSPALYAQPEIFHDITVGNNEGCNIDGFSAARG